MYHRYHIIYHIYMKNQLPNSIFNALLFFQPVFKHLSNFTLKKKNLKIETK